MSEVAFVVFETLKAELTEEDIMGKGAVLTLKKWESTFTFVGIFKNLVASSTNEGRYRVMARVI
jgi:hypothetical protein